MKRIGVAVMALAVLAAGPAFAQQPGGKPDEQRPPGASTPGAGGAGTAPAGPGMMMPMEMCRQMMAMHGGRGPMGGGMMGPMMMPMMEGGTADPKAAAEMLQMRGEMMKAIGDIMMKYGQRMQSGR